MKMDTIKKITHAWRRGSLFRKSTVSLGLALLLASCSQDDRISTVTCDRDPEGPLAVTTELMIDGKRTSVTGYLNSWGFSLGSIVRINPASTRSEAAVEWQQLPLSASDLLISPAALQPIIPLEGFEVHLDEDLKTMGHNMGVDLGDTVLKYTGLYFDRSNVRSLVDVSSLLNRDPTVVERIRNNRDTPLAIVFRTIDSNGLYIFNTYNSVGLNTIELGRTYVHVSYSCRLFKTVRHIAYKAMSDVPIIIYLTPIRYDDSTARVVFDPAK